MHPATHNTPVGQKIAVKLCWRTRCTVCVSPARSCCNLRFRQKSVLPGAAAGTVGGVP